MTGFTVLCLILESRVTCVEGDSTCVACITLPFLVDWRVW
jgi:hypothetical protein